MKQRSGQHGDGFLFRSKMVSRLGTGILSLLLVVGLSVISSSPALAGTTTSSLAITTSPSSPQVFGTSVMITATMNPSGATGTVNFEASSNGSTYASVSGCTAQTIASGVATCTTTALPLGTIDLEGVYSGDGTYAVSTSPAFAFHVTPGPTQSTVAITSESPSSPQHESTPVTITATVTTGATGTVNFESSTNGTVYSTITGCGAQSVSSNTASCPSTTALPLGTVDLEAIYSGDGTYASSTSSAVSYQITTGTTPSAVTGIGATPNSPVLVGTTVTITATVTSGATGTVDFEYSKDGVTFTGITGCSSQTVSSNSASCVTAQVPVGTLYLDAVYSGDGTYESATGTAYSYHVISGSTTSSVAISSIAPGGIAVFGTSVTISAVVNAGATGTVEIESSLTGVTYSPVSGCTITPIASNTSTCQTTSLPLGTADLEAVYSGDATYAPSTSAVLPYSVRYASTAALTGVSPASSATYASPVTITATVITGATGTVAFEASTNNASFSNLSDCASVAVSVATHTATCTTLVLPTGLDYLKALYSGDLNYAPVTSATIVYTITQATQKSLSITSTNGATGKPLALTTSGGSGTGAVTFTVSNGTASGCSISGASLSAAGLGTCIVTATKAADTNYVVLSSSPTTVSFVVEAPRVTQVIGVVRTGAVSVVSVAGNYLYGQPTIISNEAGLSARVTKDTGSVLSVRLVVTTHAKSGVHVLTFIFKNGQRASLRFNVR